MKSVLSVCNVFVHTAWRCVFLLVLLHSPAFGDLNQITITTGFSGKISSDVEEGLFYAGVNTRGYGEGLLWSNKNQDAYHTSADSSDGSHLYLSVEKIGYEITVNINTGLTKLDGTWEDPYYNPNALNNPVEGGYVNRQTLLPDYFGELDGTYIGEADGAWNVIVFETGYCEGDLFYNNQAYKLVGGAFPGEGGAELVMVARILKPDDPSYQSEQMAFHGKIKLLSGSGREVRNGFWTNTHSQLSGTFSGLSDDASGSPSEAGGSSTGGAPAEGSGGCFVSSLWR